MLDLVDEVGLDQFVDLCARELLMFYGLPPCLLSNILCIRVDCEAMLNHLARHPVQRFLDECIDMSPDEGIEPKFLFGP